MDLQEKLKILESHYKNKKEVYQKIGVSRWAYWLWQTGKCYPQKPTENYIDYLVETVSKEIKSRDK